MKLHIGEGLELPLDAITQTFGILAVRGAGKSNLAAVMAEEMHSARLPFVVVDPVGAWWGLRSSADGKSAGIEIPIFGGRHGDVPLEKTGGQVIADLVVDERASCILDISELSEGDKTRFLIDFAERLYRRNTDPLHLFLEEADDYAPQRPFREQARLLGAWERVVRRGRARGVGITLITQRSAALNKNVLTQVETLFVLRTTSPQDRKAIEGWVEYHGQRRELLESLPSLKAGEAWIWSPQWLGIAKRIQVRRRGTFDSGATPKHLTGARPAATLADVDLGKVRKQMAATIERAKQEDPRELRRRIQELERQVAAKPEAKIETKLVEVAALKPGDLARTEKLIERLGAIQGKAVEVANHMGEQASELSRAIGAANQRPTPRPGPPSRATLPGPRRTSPALDTRARRRSPSVASAETLPRAERRILQALARYPDGRTKRQVAILTGYAITGGGFNNALGALRSAGRIGGTGDNLAITPKGLGALNGDWEPLPTGPDLLAYWESELPKAERLILHALAVPRRSMSKAELADHAGYEVSGGGFNNALGRLRALELISGRDQLEASEDLFA